MVSMEPRSLTATMSMSAPCSLAAEEVSADATETVDGDANSHEDSSIDGKRGVVRRRWRTVGGYETRSKSAAASRRGSWADWSAPTSS